MNIEEPGVGAAFEMLGVLAGLLKGTTIAADENPVVEDLYGRLAAQHGLERSLHHLGISVAGADEHEVAVCLVAGEEGYQAVLVLGDVLEALCELLDDPLGGLVLVVGRHQLRGVDAWRDRDRGPRFVRDG